MKKGETHPVSVEQLEGALKSAKHAASYSSALVSTLYALLVVAAASILIATLVMPIIHVSGSSMTPVIGDGDIAAVVRTTDLQRGDVVAFYFNNKVLIKRVIGLAGDVIEIDERGNVKVNGDLLDEPYVSERALGDCDIRLPYRVDDGRFFVMGDHRSTSKDSRNQLIGAIAEEDILGRVVVRVWPLNKIGLIR